ncbi:LINE-1 retrotransposable element ORF2 protein [Symbiodinium microadriaticum]|uniref:LINE-1 retrotransposable element ORF2 protein n=1 Tax=Symbiodinium microadriaticum TaxID=2951 RepID=A0A1Q9BY78_SYMMI|nr:LINE-1 retrotransposable element ORF2 protein [Symbiodinium microadriaticum]
MAPDQLVQTFAVIAQGCTPGQQTVPRAELTAIVWVSRWLSLTPHVQATVYSDCQPAIDLWTKWVSSGWSAVCNYANADLLRDCPRPPAFQLRKIKAHRSQAEIRGLSPWHQWLAAGNTAADEAAKAARAPIAPALLDMAQTVADHCTREQNLLVRFCRALLDLGVLEVQQRKASATSLTTAGSATDLTLDGFLERVRQRQAPALRYLPFPAAWEEDWSSWKFGLRYGQKLLEWLQSLVWPMQPVQAADHWQVTYVELLLHFCVWTSTMPVVENVFSPGNYWSLPAAHAQLQHINLRMLVTVFRASLMQLPKVVGFPVLPCVDLKHVEYAKALNLSGQCPGLAERPFLPGMAWIETLKGLATSEHVVHFLLQTIDEAKKLIPVLPLQPRKAWISRGTLDLITKLRDSTGLTPEEVKAFRKCIKKSARQDKRLFVKNNLTKDYESTPSQWTTLRKLKKPFSTKTPGIRDPEGKLHSTKQKPEVFCKYLTQHVWKSADEQMPPQSMLHPVIPEIFRPFTEEDLYQCMKQLQVGKATGPDGIPAELIKRAPYVVQKFILSHYNKCLRTGSIPDAWLLSEVVMLVKDARKDTLSLDNYRPISLTDVFYKLYAALLQKRLAFYVDPRIRDTQYGFRRGKSTSQPIHILRRLIETHERQQSPLHILFVDWAKAFDSVSFAAIERSLVRLGVPAAFVRAVMAIYNNPQFRVKDSGSTSEVGVQSRGVRQGCPLSPYLFDIILTCLFADVEASYEEQFGILTGVLRLPSCLWDLEYADDTASRRYMEDIFPLQMK